MILLFLQAFLVTFTLAADKSGYTLLNPTPENLLRSSRTERPDKTRTAYTVDAGHFQIESELLTLQNEGQTSGLEALNSNFRVGLTNKSELQFQVESYRQEKDEEERLTRRGFGGTTLRLKYNLQGNDSRKVAVALMPLITLPTAGANFGSRKTQYGLILPVDLILQEGWRAGFMFQLGQDVKENKFKGMHEIASFSLSRQIFKKTWAYVEYFYQRTDHRDSQVVATSDFVLQYELTERFSLDIGTFLGTTKASEKQNYFLGAAFLI